MTRFRLSLAVALLWPLAAFGQPRLVIPAEVKPAGQYVDLLPDTDAKSVSYIGMDGIDSFPARRLNDPRLFILDTRGLPAGVYRFAAVGTLLDKQTTVYFVVRIGDSPGPGPGPDPKPPEPKPPTPTPAPIPDAGFRVLIVYETADKLTSAQQAVIGSTVLRAYMDSHCVKRSGDNQPEYRIWDKDVVNQGLENESTIWQNAFKRPRASTPWLILSDGKKGWEGPLPANVADTLKKLQEIGGP